MRKLFSDDDKEVEDDSGGGQENNMPVGDRFYYDIFCVPVGNSLIGVPIIYGGIYPEVIVTSKSKSEPYLNPLFYTSYTFYGNEPKASGQGDLNFTHKGDQVLSAASGFLDYAGAFMFGRTYTDKMGIKWSVNLDGKATGLAPITGMVPTPALKAAKAGQVVHSMYNPGSNYILNKAIPGTRLRPDAIDPIKKIIRELKPNNPAAIKRGWKQLEMYRNAANDWIEGTWQLFIDIY